MLDSLLLIAETAVQDGALAGSPSKLWAYLAFLGLVIVFLALDLGVFHRHAHEVSMREAATWSVVWLTCGVAFAAFVYFAYDHHWLGLGIDTLKYNPAYAADDPTSRLIISGVVSGGEAAKQYLVGYVVEKSLAMDNIFVIALIFSYFAVPAKYQHRVLFWGILGALLMRGGMIFLGAGLIQKYQWILIVFGGFLVLTALKMALIKGHDDVSQNLAVRVCRKLFRVTEFYDGQRFFTRRTAKPTYSIDPRTGQEVMDPPPEGSLSPRFAATPLFLALLLVEITDLVFAVDSIPAIFSITPDPFIVFTSNIFAILGLRALYFCLAAMMSKFRYLKPALVIILAFVGVKLLLLSTPPYLDDAAALVGITRSPLEPIKIGTGTSMGVVLGVLALSVVASLLHARRARHGTSAAAPRSLSSSPRAEDLDGLGPSQKHPDKE
jgi:tellurite resistance protein TerC